MNDGGGGEEAEVPNRAEAGPKERSFETTLVLDATVEEVWRALTDAQELTNWFPLEARITPGVGGNVFLSWGSAWQGDSRIEIWEPGRRLRTVSRRETAYDLDGVPVAPQEGHAGPVEIAVEYHLESRGQKTVLRLVHSGFGSDASWDDELDSISKGWKFELRGLRHYLARHRGTQRHVAWAMTKTRLSPTDAWTILTGPSGFLLERPEALAEGDRYSVRAATGDVFSGLVHQALPPKDFSGTVEGQDWNDGLLRLAVERFGESSGINVWLATWGVDPARVAAFQERAAQRLSSLFSKEVVGGKE